MEKSLSGYTCHTGGALGADAHWKSIGNSYGVTCIDWRPHHLSAMNNIHKEQLLMDVTKAAEVLNRPTSFKGVGLVHRNWFIAHHAEAIFAIGAIVNPGEEDYKGFLNKAEKQVLAGGTAWATEMAIQKGKFAYVFDINKKRWYIWVESENRFVWCPGAPILTKSFGGIGSRFLPEEGREAIKAIYQKTIEYENNIKV